jgi:hypothetical protein
MRFHFHLCRGDLGAILLDAFLHSLQLSAHLLLGILHLSVDLGFESAKATVDICEFHAKIFAELIDALAHDNVLIFAIYDWFPRRKRARVRNMTVPKHRQMQIYS